MQGVILNAGRFRGLIRGDDGARLHPSLGGLAGGDDLEPAAETRVDFEVRGSDALDIFPILGVGSSPPTLSSPAPQTTEGAPAALRPHRERSSAAQVQFMEWTTTHARYRIR